MPVRDTVGPQRRLWRTLSAKAAACLPWNLHGCSESLTASVLAISLTSCLKHNMSAHAGVDHGREPCPYRILGDIGGAFGMGAVGGGIWHLVKGTKNSPSGARLRGGLEVRFTCLHACYGPLNVCTMAVRAEGDSFRGSALEESTPLSIRHRMREAELRAYNSGAGLCGCSGLRQFRNAADAAAFSFCCFVEGFASALCYDWAVEYCCSLTITG